MEKQPIVTTKLGTIEGKRVEIGVNSICEVFLGIPYAQPPINELRFEKPEPIKPWHGVLEAKEFGPASISHIIWPPSKRQLLFEDEDCLKLNIFRPQLDVNEKLRPVLAYIHGGGFCAGSTRDYGFKNLCEKFVCTNLKFIVVTIQYRLGVFGFLTDGSDNLPGNYGLFDQALALKFLHENIQSFGGNPEKIVAWGLSAGGASCSALNFSSYTKDLISSTIEMSGILIPAWSSSDQCIDVGKQLLYKLSGDYDNIKQIDNIKLNNNLDRKIITKNVLKTKSVDKIQRAVFSLNTTRAGFNLLKYHPRIDNDFFPSNTFDFLNENKSSNLFGKKPCLMSLTSCEGLYFTLLAKDVYINQIFIPKNLFKNFDANMFRQNILKLLKNCDGFPEEHHSDAADYILNFYLNKKSLYVKQKRTTNFYLEKYSELFSDVLFNTAAIWMARARAKSGIPTFIYFNEYFNPMQFSSFNASTSNENENLCFYSATHANEYPYLHGLFPIGKFTFNETDLLHQKQLIQIISSFVQNGKPSVDGIKNWPPIPPNESEPIPFLKFNRITSELSIETEPELEERSKFWLNFKKQFQFDLIQNKKLNE